MTLAQQSEKTQSAPVTVIDKIPEITKEIHELYLLDEIPLIIGVSWGKDSSTILQLIWNAIAALPPKKRSKKIHVITTDTLVENPIVSAWVRNSVQMLASAAKEKGMPIEPH